MVIPDRRKSVASATTTEMVSIYTWERGVFLITLPFLAY